AVLLLIPFMNFRGVNVVRPLLINLECVGGLQFDRPNDALISIQQTCGSVANCNATEKEIYLALTS
nr:hypothetical protein [Clostridia bacterium]